MVKCSDDVEHVKPDPALFRLALQEMGIEPDEAIVFEDSPNGIAASKEAGIFTVVVPNGMTKTLPVDGADLTRRARKSLSCAV